ncbi:MAG TPA: hypothetical protein VD947_02280 [Patescibacteria group bacterium]|nr:hypothetical protein [Patescibacteria group bacterium]
MDPHDPEKVLLPDEILAPDLSQRVDVLRVLGFIKPDQGSDLSDDIDSIDSYMLEISLGILHRLNEQGIDGVTELFEKLDEVVAENEPMRKGLSTVATVLDEERARTDDGPEAKSQLKHLSSLASAVFSVSVATALGPTKSLEARKQLGYSQRRLGACCNL